MSKVISAEEVSKIIKDESSVVWSTAGLCGFAEEVALAIEENYIKKGYPKDLTIIHTCGCGDGKNKGMNRLGHEGLVKRLISGHTGLAPKMGDLILKDKIQAYLLPQGVMAHLFRHIAGKKAGVITKVGMGTYVDPRLEGGKVTPSTKEDLVKVINLEGEEWLHYRTIPIDVAIIRGTTADLRGNITMEKEAIFLESLSMAQAAKNSGGIVIAQVEYLSEEKSLHPQKVKVPGDLVDYILVADQKNHWQTQGTYYNPALSGDVKMPLDNIKPMDLEPRKIIARRASMELSANSVINLGIGMPEGVANVAAEEGISDLLTLTTELGTYGGVPASGADFSTAYNAEAIIDHGYQFDFYDGGGLDGAFLGLAQVDRFGNLNVSKFGSKVVGPGGFINISQSSKKVVFCGTFTNGAKIKIENGKVNILEEGNRIKFVDKVDQITFSGEYAEKAKIPVLFITERAVFTIDDGEITLIEVAPGIDIDKDILPLMEFKPKISENLKEMPEEIFYEKWGNLKNIIINKDKI